MPARVAAVRPLWAIEGGRLSIEGSGYQIDQPQLPKVYLGEAPARVVYASPTRVDAVVPPGLEGGRTPIRIDDGPGNGSADDLAPSIEIASLLATGLHQVDNPVFDRAGNLYVTYS